MEHLRSVNLKTAPNTALVIDPTAVLADGHPICFDPDGNALTYAIRTPNPTNGVAAAAVGPPATVTYTPNATVSGWPSQGDPELPLLSLA